MDKSKKKIYEILYYEISMLSHTHGVLQGLHKNSFEFNVYLESFLVHAFCLYSFFYKKKRFDDVCINDFTINESVFEQNKSLKIEFEKIKFPIKRDKQLAHITLSRIELESRGEKPWDYEKIYILLRRTIRAFIESLSEEERKLLPEVYI